MSWATGVLLAGAFLLLTFLLEKIGRLCVFALVLFILVGTMASFFPL